MTVPQTQLIIRKSSENKMRFPEIDNFRNVIAVGITCHKYIGAGYARAIIFFYPYQSWPL